MMLLAESSVVSRANFFIWSLGVGMPFFFILTAVLSHYHSKRLRKTTASLTPEEKQRLSEARMAEFQADDAGKRTGKFPISMLMPALFFIPVLFVSSLGAWFSPVFALLVFLTIAMQFWDARSSQKRLVEAGYPQKYIDATRRSRMTTLGLSTCWMAFIVIVSWYSTSDSLKTLNELKAQIQKHQFEEKGR